MKRSVQPEILDSLPENHPDAVANRRDLRLINGIMGNFRWFRRALPRELRPGDRILELGAGTGDLGLALREACGGKAIRYCGLDLWSRPPEWPAAWDWIREDLLSFQHYSEYTILVANLILHQFSDFDLERIGVRVKDSRIRLILANEPRRHKIHQGQLQLLRPFGLHPISRHDGNVSVAAGFQGAELAERLGLTDAEWNVEIRSGFLGWYRLIAKRKEQAP